MNILFLSTWFPYPPDNGAKIRVYHLLRALGRSHQVTLISFADETTNPDRIGDLSRFRIEVQAIRRNPFERGSLASALRFFSPTPIVTRPLPEMTQAVQRTLARTSFDTVIASFEVTACYALRAPQTATKVLEEHNFLTRWMWERYRAQRSAVQRLRCWVSWQKARRYEARLFRQFDLCTLVSDQDRDASLQMLAGYRGPAEVVPNGVDCEYNHPGLAQPVPNSLIFNGALTYYPNHDAMRYFLGEIFPRIQQRVPDSSLTITGSTSGVNLESLGLNDQVYLSGYVDDIRPLVAGASVCVVPVRDGGGTRLKILEAMALGTPVVATSKGAEGIDAMHGEHILLADDAETFADCTLRLMGDSTMRQRMVTNARHLVEERYNWKQIGDRFVALVESVQGCRGP